MSKEHLDDDESSHRACESDDTWSENKRDVWKHREREDENVEKDMRKNALKSQNKKDEMTNEKRWHKKIRIHDNMSSLRWDDESIDSIRDHTWVEHKNDSILR